MLRAWLPTHVGPHVELPPLTGWRLLTEWEPALLPLLGTAVVGGLYLYGVHRLRQRGDSWSRWRTLFFVGLGLGSFLLATTSALAVYDTTLLYVHMVQHMVLGMVVPIFLALGAPITLALRVLPRRGRGVLLSVLHSRVAKVLTFPVVAGILFVANPFALYLTGWYEATLRNPFLHDLNHLHFVFVGCLWFWPILGLDPLPNRHALPDAAARRLRHHAVPRLPGCDDHGRVDRDGPRLLRRHRTQLGPHPVRRTRRSPAGCCGRAGT